MTERSVLDVGVRRRGGRSTSEVPRPRAPLEPSLFHRPPAVPEARPEPLPPAGQRWSRSALLGILALGVLLIWRVAVAAARLPAAVGETQLIDGASAVLRGTTPLGVGLGEFAARAQLVGHASLTGAFDRHPDLLGGARELAVVSVAVLLVALVAMAWQLSARPAAVAVVLALLAVSEPAIAALATFGPGLLGVTWTVVGVALLVMTRPVTRVVGAVAVVVGVVTAPVLAVPIAVAVVVMTARRWAPAAEVAAALGSAALVLVLLSPMAAATSAVVGSERLVLAVAAVAVAVGGFVLPGLRAPAAVVGSLVLLAALPWPGADVAVPALVVAVVLVGTALVHELASRLAGQGVRVVRGLAVVAVAGWIALLVPVAQDLRPVPDGEPAHTALAAWIATSTDPGTTVAAPPDLQADLVRDGVAPQRLVPGGELVVRRDPVGSGTGGPADLARFGDAAGTLSVAPADPPEPTAAAAEVAARTRAGGQLAGNPNLDAPEGVQVVLRAGGVDSRALVLLAGLTGQSDVRVADLPVVPGEDVALPRHRVVLSDVDAPTLTWLRAQRPPFAPTVTAAPGGGTTLTWPLPAPSALLG